MANRLLPGPPRSPARSRRARRAGFTIIELMIVVVIIGISAALIAPSISRTMGISRTNRCQYDAARLFRSARASAIGSGRAHLVHLEPTAGDVQLRVFIGDSSSCPRSTWGGIVGTAQPVDFVSEAHYTSGAHGVRLRYLPPAGGGATPQQVCFEPLGERYERPGTVGAWAPSRATVIFAIDRLENGAPAGDPQRQIIVPQFGTPRVLR